MDVIRLRTMTRKSKFGESSRFNGRSVGELIDSGNASYLVWAYYNIQNITYTDEVLDEIKIFERHRIPKPGINKEMRDIRLMDYAKAERRKGNFAPIGKIKSNIKRRNKDIQMQTERQTRMDNSPARLTWLNQGHY